MKKVIFIIVAVGTSLMSCQFNTDCGAGGNCVKSGFSIYGTCM